jgi:hypothetical protein
MEYGGAKGEYGEEPGKGHARWAAGIDSADEGGTSDGVQQ